MHGQDIGRFQHVALPLLKAEAVEQLATASESRGSLSLYTREFLYLWRICGPRKERVDDVLEEKVARTY